MEQKAKERRKSGANFLACDCFLCFLCFSGALDLLAYDESGENKGSSLSFLFYRPLFLLFFLFILLFLLFLFKEIQSNPT